MSKPRYSMVRVDKLKHCPIYEGITGFCRNSGCDDCKMKKNYGDTKEQLVNKVAQELTRQIYKNNFRIKDVAQKIVEFLGVEG